MRPATYAENWPDPLHRGDCGCRRCADGELDRIVRRTLTVAQRHAQNRFAGIEQDAPAFKLGAEVSPGAAAHYGNLIVLPKPVVPVSEFLTQPNSGYKGQNRQWIYRFFLRPEAKPGCGRLNPPYDRPFYIGRVSRQSANGLKERINEHMRRGKALITQMNPLGNKVNNASDAIGLAQQYRAGKPVFGKKISGSTLFDFILASLESQFCVQVAEVCLSGGSGCNAPAGASLLAERAHIFRDNAHINRPYEEEDEDEVADAVANLAIVDLRR